MKPRIIVVDGGDPDTFSFLSDGWYCEKLRGTPEAEDIMVKAQTCIQAGHDHNHVIVLLQLAGFEVEDLRETTH